MNDNIRDIDDFNIEKWRREQPMDYLKAVNLLETSQSNDSKNLIFQTVYDITRLFIPDTLFKYYCLDNDEILNEMKLKTLQEKKVYLSKSIDFNDPFDNKAFYYRPEKLNEFEELKRCEGKIIDDFSSFNVGCSFCDTGINSMTMWAHYANNHLGYCAAYDTRKDMENSELRTFAFPIQYVDERIDITDIMYKQIQIILNEKKRQIALGRKVIQLDDFTLIFIAIWLSHIKFKDWEKEREFRVSVGSNTNKKYCKAIPSAIYIGMNCTRENERKLIIIAKQQNIPVFKMIYSDLTGKFDLGCQQLF